MSRPLLQVSGVVHEYPVRRGRPVRVLDGVDLTVAAGEVVGLVGESGSGKTTLGRAIVGLVRPVAGTVVVDGTAVSGPGATRAVQVVFQDPYLSLNPRLSVGRSVAEPLTVGAPGGGRGRARARARRARVAELLESVGVASARAAARPGELSGGERQRVAIARALAARPRLLVLDEPVSALDPSIGAQVMALLSELRRRDGLAYLLIAHDLPTVGSVADRVAVIDAGRIVEEGPPERVLSAPASARGRELVAAAQVLSPPPWAWPGETVQA